MYQCILCNSDRLSLISSQDRNGKGLKNYICEDCSFISVHPRKSLNENKEYYESGAFSVEARKDKIPSTQKINSSDETAHLRVLKTNGVDKKIFSGTKKILEVGCGMGSMLRFLDGMGHQTTGIEMDESYVQFSNNFLGLNVIKSSLEDFTPHSSYDVITTFHVIEHVNDPKFFLSKIRSLLSNDGYLILECPSIDMMYGSDKNYFFWEPHINSFSNLTLRRLIVETGFEILHESYFEIGRFIIAKKIEKSSIREKTPIAKEVKRIKTKVANYNPNDLYQKAIRVKNRLKLRYSESPKTFLEKAQAEYRLKKRINSTKDTCDFVHVAHQNAGNAGDTVLSSSVRLFIDFASANSNKWKLIHTHDKVVQETVDIINRSKALIIGGGGLFLRDTNENSHSGWQWPITNELLEKIQVPIIVYSVGYNKFRNQIDFDNTFYKSMKLLLDKSPFFGLRNSGSISNVKNFSGDLEKIVFQPCVTTFLKKFHPALKNFSPTKTGVVAINIAFDRHHLRFGKDERVIIHQIVDAMTSLKKMGKTPVLVAHCSVDRHIKHWINDFDFIDLTHSSQKKIINTFKQFEMVIGMRGHSQMIPFGMGIPIYSLVSHNKLQFFLDDIGKPDWGTELNGKFSDKIVSFVNNYNFEENWKFINSRIDNLYETSSINWNNITSIIND